MGLCDELNNQSFYIKADIVDVVRAVGLCDELINQSFFIDSEVFLMILWILLIVGTF